MPTKAITTKAHAVTVTFEPNAGYWMMDVGNGRKGPPDYPTLEVPYNHKGEITFRITDTPGVSFANPAFVQKKGKPDPGDFGAQFQAKVTGNGKILTILDANTSPNGQRQNKDYHYELNFTNEVPLDPIITNMGCCRSTADYSAYYAIGAGVALVAFYLFFIRPWLARRAAGSGPAATHQAPPRSKDTEEL